jgi:hypothetical protein
MATLSLSRPYYSVENDSMIDWLSIIRAEYLEMPGLNLTARQAQRLWHLEPGSCDRLLNTLVETGFLHKTTEGVYRREHAEG